MSDEKGEKGGVAPSLVHVRITCVTDKKSVTGLEQFVAKLNNNAVIKGIQTKGPVRMPTKRLSIATRKTPNGEGSKTWDHYEKKISKRYIDLINTTPELVKAIISMSPLESGITVEVTLTK